MPELRGPNPRTAPHEPHPRHALARSLPERTSLSPLPTPPFHILLPSSARLATSVAARHRTVAAARSRHVGAPAAASTAAAAAAAAAAAVLLLLPPPPSPLLRPLLPAQGNLLYGVLRPRQRRRRRLAGGLAAHFPSPHPCLALERTPAPFSHPPSPAAAPTHLTRTRTHTHTHTHR